MAGTTRTEQKEDTRRRIVEAAYGEFVRLGIMATRMDDVAKAAGVSHGSVFLHFKTQDALVAEVISAYCGRIAERTHELAAGEPSLRDMLSAHLVGIAEYEPFYTRILLEVRMLPTECRAAWVSLQSAVSFHLSRAAEREMEAGKIKQVPLHMLFNLWMGLVSYYLANGDLFAPEGFVVLRYGQELLESFIKLIKT